MSRIVNFTYKGDSLSIDATKIFKIYSNYNITKNEDNTNKISYLVEVYYYDNTEKDKDYKIYYFEFVDTKEEAAELTVALTKLWSEKLDEIENKENLNTSKKNHNNDTERI